MDSNYGQVDSELEHDGQNEYYYVRDAKDGKKTKLEKNKRLKLFEYNKKGTKKKLKDFEKRAEIYRKIADDYYEESRELERKATMHQKRAVEISKRIEEFEKTAKAMEKKSVEFSDQAKVYRESSNMFFVKADHESGLSYAADIQGKAALAAANEYSNYAQQTQYYITNLKKNADQAEARAKLQSNLAETFKARVKQCDKHRKEFLKQSKLAEKHSAEAYKSEEEFNKKAQEFYHKAKLATMKSRYMNELYQHYKLTGQEKRSLARKQQEDSLFYQEKSREMGEDSVSVDASGAEMLESEKVEVNLGKKMNGFYKNQLQKRHFLE